MKYSRIAAAIVFLLAMPLVFSWMRAAMSRGWIGFESVSLPPRGEGFRSYSTVGNALGRQHVHPKLARALIAAARELKDSGPPIVIGETGWRTGGLFLPHLTHKQGLSVDIFVPLKAPDFSLLNQFGYGFEVEETEQIDLERLKAIVKAVCNNARQEGLKPKTFLIHDNWAEEVGLCGVVPGRNPRSKGLVTLDHDDHFHLDFEVAK